MCDLALSKMLLFGFPLWFCTKKLRNHKSRVERALQLVKFLDFKQIDVAYNPADFKYFGVLSRHKLMGLNDFHLFC